MSTPLQTVEVRAACAGAPVSGWRRALGDWLLVGSTTAVGHVIGAATSLLLRILLSPAQMGVWQTVKLLLTYGNYTNLGISKGAVRELTIAQGSGDEALAHEGLNLAFTINTLTSVAYAAVLIGVGVWLAFAGNNVWALSLVVAGCMAVVARFSTFHITILRGQQSFGTTSRLSMLEGVLTLTVAVTATWLWGLPGLYLGTLAVMLAAAAYVTLHRGASLAWAWNPAKAGRLIGIGGPILLATTLFTLFRSLDKLMILAYLGDGVYQLGCYSVALMVVAQIYGLGGIATLVMSPRYGEKFGKSASHAEVARLAARTGELQAAIMSIAGGLSLVLAGPLLGWLLPRYQLGLVPMNWLIPGVVLLSISLPANHYLIAINRQRRAVLVVLSMIVLAGVGNHMALMAGWGLVGVAMATSAAYAVYWIFIVGVSIWIELSQGERFRHLGMTALVLLPTMAAAWLLTPTVEPSVAIDWPRLALGTAAVMGVWSMTALIAWRVGGWREQFAQ